MAPKRASAPATPPPAPARPPYMLIEEIRVQGYKSLVDATLHVWPLTLLAGTNSSGKSSIMQPLLLIKQTMEANYNPAGALILNGAHVQADTAGELVSKISNSNKQFKFAVRGEYNYVGSAKGPADRITTMEIETVYVLDETNFAIISHETVADNDEQSRVRIKPGMSEEEIINQLVPTVINQPEKTSRFWVEPSSGFLNVIQINAAGERGSFTSSFFFRNSLAVLMHIPGLRSRPQRTYPASVFQNQIKGTFDLYAAGTVSQWQEQGKTKKLADLNKALSDLGLTDSVTAKVKNANEVELSVSRLPAGSKGRPRKADMVNIADVGIGVSQVLPIVVALIAAQEGQLVYVEQPELHLHPRAQVAMAELLAEAANRGVRVIVETHSSLLLLTVQTLIAQGKIKHTDVAMHWFSRDAKGATKVEWVEPDEDGAYGDWPEDFGDVELKAQDAYLTAVGLRAFGEAPNA